MVGEEQGPEAEALLHPGQDAHTGDTDPVALLRLLLAAGHLIPQTGLLGLVPDTIKHTLSRFTSAMGTASAVVQVDHKLKG